jgi:hypothetical protein
MKTYEKVPPITDWRESWVGPRNGLDNNVKRKFLTLLCPEL